MSNFSLSDLEVLIAERATAKDGSSWTAKLVGAGIEKASKKLGEEAVETVIAALGDDKTATVSEAADLLYHLLVVMHMKGVSVDEVMAELQSRTNQSGIAEKAARKDS